MNFSFVLFIYFQIHFPIICPHSTGAAVSLLPHGIFIKHPQRLKIYQRVLFSRFLNTNNNYIQLIIIMRTKNTGKYAIEWKNGNFLFGEKNEDENRLWCQWHQYFGVFIKFSLKTLSEKSSKLCCCSVMSKAAPIRSP